MRNYDKVAAIRATDNSVEWERQYLETARRMKYDVARVERLNKNECRYCFYVQPHVGGSRTTISTCEICEGEIGSENTCINKLCEGCAEEHSLCVRCGGDREGRTRRRVWPK